MRTLSIAAGLALWLALALWPAPSSAADRHAGYYYPLPSSNEVYKSRARTLDGMDRRARIAFVVSVVEQMNEKPYPPGLSFFAKGEDAEKLIMVSNFEGRLNTVFRARALLASLTSVARTTPIFVQNKVEDILTFLDLLKMLGFNLVTISDGELFAHQIKIQ